MKTRVKIGAGAALLGALVALAPTAAALTVSKVINAVSWIGNQMCITETTTVTVSATDCTGLTPPIIVGIGGSYFEDDVFFDDPIGPFSFGVNISGLCARATNPKSPTFPFATASRIDKFCYTVTGSSVGLGSLGEGSTVEIGGSFTAAMAGSTPGGPIVIQPTTEIPVVSGVTQKPAPAGGGAGAGGASGTGPGSGNNTPPPAPGPGPGPGDDG